MLGLSRLFRKKAYWRLNIGVEQLAEMNLDGAEAFLHSLPREPLYLPLDAAAGEKLAERRIGRGDAFLLTAVYKRGANVPPDISHLAIARGEIEDYSVTATGRAKVALKSFVRLDSHHTDRVVGKPKRNVNWLHPALKKKYFDAA